MSLFLLRSDLIASARPPDRIPTCSGGAATMSSDDACVHTPVCARAGMFAKVNMQPARIANRKRLRSIAMYPPPTGRRSSPIFPTSISPDQIDRAGPGLVAVSLRDTQPDREVRAAGELHDVIQLERAAPVILRQAIDTELPSEPTTIELDGLVGQ